MSLWTRVRARLRRDPSSSSSSSSSEGTHDDDRLPTSAMIPGSAASGVWSPRRQDSFLGSGDESGPSPDDDFLKPQVR